MSVRTAEAVWEGTSREGKGVMRSGSGAFEGKYTWKSRFEEEPGTNPEELIAAAEAGCFSMALSSDLGKAGFTPKRIETTTRVTIERIEGASTISKVEVETRAEVPGIDQAQFLTIAEGAKKGCPVSRALAAVKEITLKASLVSG